MAERIEDASMKHLRIAVPWLLTMASSLLSIYILQTTSNERSLYRSQVTGAGLNIIRAQGDANEWKDIASKWEDSSERFELLTNECLSMLKDYRAMFEPKTVIPPLDER